MPIELTTGNILKADTQAVVNPVNTVGVMGAGLALQVKLSIPEAFEAYSAACKDGSISTGKVQVVRLKSDRYVINFPTKQHWRHPSKLEYVSEGLKDLVKQLNLHRITSVAIPALGCGLGGLYWKDVKPLIVDAFSDHPEITVVLFEPMR